MFSKKKTPFTGRFEWFNFFFELLDDLHFLFFACIRFFSCLFMIKMPPMAPKWFTKHEPCEAGLKAILNYKKSFKSQSSQKS